MAQKITYWLLTTLILTLGFGQLLRFDFYGLPLYLHDILVILILVSLFWRTVLIGPGLKLFLLALILSSLRALTLYPLSSLVVPGLYALRLLAYLALYVSLRSSKIIVPQQVFVISGMLTIAIGLAQYFFIPDMRWAQYLGWDDHLSRLTLPHFDPTFTGVMICLFALSVLGTNTVFRIPVVTLSGLAILLTYARSVWLSLFLLACLFIKNKKILLITVVILLVSVLALPKKFGEGTNLFRTYSISSRAESDLGYLKKYNWDLIIGRGVNTHILENKTSPFKDHANGPNNSYLYLLTTTGILGLIGWLMFMSELYRHSMHKQVIVFLLISSLFNNVMFYPFALLWIFLLEAVIDN